MHGVSPMGSTSEAMMLLAAPRPIHILPWTVRNRPALRDDLRSILRVDAKHAILEPEEKENAGSPVGVLTLQGGTAKPDPAVPGWRRAEGHTCSYSTFSLQQAALSPHTWRRRAPLGLRNSLRLNHSEK